MRTKKDTTEKELNIVHNSTVLALKDKLSLSKPFKDKGKRMSVAEEKLLNEYETSPSIMHAVSMPVLSCTNCIQQRQEIDSLHSEIEQLKKELAAMQTDLENHKVTEKTLRDRLAEEALKQISRSERFEDISLGTNRPTALVQLYGALHTQSRVDALDSLDSLPELDGLDSLKNKLLFSVIVLSFRSCQQKVAQLREALLSTFEVKEGKVSSNMEPAVSQLRESMAVYLRQSMDWTNTSDLTREVQSQIHATLYDYPCLRQCSKLHQYVEECVKVAWKLTVQNPPSKLEFDCRQFNPNRHIRFHTSDGESSSIKSYIWPTLTDSKTNACLYKGVVHT